MTTIDQEAAARWLVLVLRLPAVEQHSAERFGALARATRRRVNLRVPGFPVSACGPWRRRRSR